MEEWLKRQFLSWYGYVLRRRKGNEVGRVSTMQVVGTQRKGRPMT